jgi:ribosomal protein S18 acetylase RimI-like enzyme
MFPIQALAPPWDRQGLELLLAGLPSAARHGMLERVLALGGTGGVPGLLGAISEGRLLGVVWAQLQPGKIATIWPPRVDAEDKQLGPRLAAAILQFAASRGVRVAQAMVAVDDVPATDWLKTAGMSPASEILSLAWLAPPTMTFALLKSSSVQPHRIEHYQPISDRERMERVLAETFVGTHDCPAIDGVRTISDVLRGYQAAGVSQSRHWYFVRHDQCDVGCLLLAQDIAPNDMELVYMGLAPRWRGRGWGTALARYAQELTVRAGRQCLLTTVDVDNTAARRVYDGAGFTQWGRHQVLFRICGDQPRKF